LTKYSLSRSPCLSITEQITDVLCGAEHQQDNAAVEWAAWRRRQQEPAVTAGTPRDGHNTCGNTVEIGTDIRRYYRRVGDFKMVSL